MLAPEQGMTQDAIFQQRLRAVNDEVQSVLSRTAQQRDRMTDYYLATCTGSSGNTKRPLLMGGPAAGAPQAAAAPPQATAADGPAMPSWPQQPQEELVRRLCETELTRWMEVRMPRAVLTCLEEQLRLELDRLSESMQRVQEQQSSAKAGLDALRARTAEERTSAQRAIEQLSDQTRQTVQQVQSRVESDLTTWRASWTLLSDKVAALQTDGQLHTQRAERRLDELVRQQQDTLRGSLAELERQTRQWKAAVEGDVREFVQDQRLQRDALEAQVARLQGMLTSCAESTNGCVTQLQALLQESGERQSEMRACRRDVNRLEMLVQCAGLTFHGELASEADKKRAKRTYGAGQAANVHDDAALLPPALLAQELLRSKESVSYLAGRLEAAERRIGQLEQALLLARPGSAASVQPAPAAAPYNVTNNNTTIHPLPQPQQPTPLTSTVLARSTPLLHSTNSPAPTMLQQQQQQQQQLSVAAAVAQLPQTAGQYVPAPTSDSESERENQQLSRLALD